MQKRGLQRHVLFGGRRKPKCTNVVQQPTPYAWEPLCYPCAVSWISYVLDLQESIPLLISNMSWADLCQPDHKVTKLLWDFND